MTIGPNFPERFERDQAFSEADWLRCLPGAVRANEELASPRPASVFYRITAQLYARR